MKNSIKKTLEQLIIEERVKKEYLKRKLRKAHPAGEFDSQGRFYLSAEEYCECCEQIRAPSISWPYSLLVHARTKKHIQNLEMKNSKKQKSKGTT